MTKVNIDQLDIAILAFHDGKVHLVAMEKEKLEAVTGLAKMATSNIIPTGKTRKELLKFLNYKEEYPT